MTRTLRGAALALACMATPALAADLPGGPYLAAPYGAYNWTGFYAGLNLGYQWASVTNTGLSPSGVAGGVQGGFNWQAGSIVLGGETDLQVSGASASVGAFEFSNPWFGTLRGRVGYALNNILFYGTGGVAFGTGTAELSGLSESHSSIGWTAGGGLEVGLTPHWTAKAEYLYIDLGAQNYALTGLSHDITSNVLRLGVNYRF
ncbi:MAG TPA: outer membrane protein [Xanthobacteraceae bacterium]|nr:outer membrane protein [Xanthobacteraceae bacterium]